KYCNSEILKAQNIDTEIINIKGHFDLFAAIKLYFLIKKYQPQIIIAHNGRTYACVNLCRKIFKNCFKNIKTVAVNHSGIAKRIMNFDYAIAIANHIKESIKKQNFKSPIKLIYNGIKVRNNPNHQSNRKS